MLWEIWNEDNERFAGPVEVDETYVGGRERNKHTRKKLRSGRGTAGKTPVLGILDRGTNQLKAMVSKNTDKDTLQEFVEQKIEEGTQVFTDDHGGYLYLKNHRSVRHSGGQYVDGIVHTNGIESFWAVLKRAHYGVYHKMSVKHLGRYVNEFVGHHNLRPLDILDRMTAMVRSMDGKRLSYAELVS